MRNHNRLKVFGLADRLSLAVYRHTRLFPPHEHFGLRAQIRRAAVSVTANIVEGAARASDADFARLLTIAYASARELEYELSLAHRLEYIPHDQYRELAELVSQVGRALRALILTVSDTNGIFSPERSG